jgi:hypothetical protein
MTSGREIVEPWASCETDSRARTTRSADSTAIDSESGQPYTLSASGPAQDGGRPLAPTAQPSARAGPLQP